MAINRELIHSTIYDRFVEAFADDEDFKTISRVLKHIDDMQPEDLHALFIIGADQNVTQQNHAPKKYTLRMDIYIYVTRKGSDDVPQTILNRALDKVDQVLDPPHGFPAQTFSIPSVQHIRVEGDIKTDEGALGDFAVAVVPLQIVAVG